MATTRSTEGIRIDDIGGSSAERAVHLDGAAALAPPPLHASQQVRQRVVDDGLDEPPHVLLREVRAENRAPPPVQVVVTRGQHRPGRLYALYHRPVALPSLAWRLRVHRLDEGRVVDVQRVWPGSHHRPVFAVHLFDHPYVLPATDEVMVCIVPGRQRCRGGGILELVVVTTATGDR